MTDLTLNVLWYLVQTMFYIQIKLSMSYHISNEIKIFQCALNAKKKENNDIKKRDTTILHNKVMSNTYTAQTPHDIVLCSPPIIFFFSFVFSLHFPKKGNNLSITGCK